MTIKNTTDGDAVSTETMADRLRSVQSEPWRKMRYTDENAEAAWEIYNESLFLRPSAEETEDEAAEVTEESAAAVANAPERDLKDTVPKFGSRWKDIQLLEHVSGIKKPEHQSDPEAEAAEAKAKKAIKPDPEEARRPKGRARGGAAVAPKRGGRAKAGPSKLATVTVD